MAVGDQAAGDGLPALRRGELMTKRIFGANVSGRHVAVQLSQQRGVVQQKAVVRFGLFALLQCAVGLVQVGLAGMCVHLRSEKMSGPSFGHDVRLPLGRQPTPQRLGASVDGQFKCLEPVAGLTATAQELRVNREGSDVPAGKAPIPFVFGPHLVRHRKRSLHRRRGLGGALH